LKWRIAAVFALNFQIPGPGTSAFARRFASLSLTSFPLLRLLAFTTACSTVLAVIYTLSGYHGSIYGRCKQVPCQSFHWTNWKKFGMVALFWQWCCRRTYRQTTPSDTISGGRDHWLGGTMASAEHERITGVWGRAPSGVQGQSPWSGGQEGIAPRSWKHFSHLMSNGAGKFSTSSWKQYVLLRSTGVRVGGPECMVPPTPSLGGLCPPGSAAYVWHANKSPPGTRGQHMSQN